MKYEKNQRLEIHGLPQIGGDQCYNGSIVTVVLLPGYHPGAPKAYGVEFKDGMVRPAVEQYLRPYPPVLPNGRADIDTKVTWEQFDAATGIKSNCFRDGFNANPEY